MKKFIALALALVMLLALVACGNSETKDENPAKSVSLIANSIVTQEYFRDYGLMAADVNLLADPETNEVFFTGFNTTITGYDEAYVIMPAASSSALIGYVFKVSEGVDKADFIKLLKDNADADYMVCDVADTIVTTSKGNVVFFFMINAQGDTTAEASIIKAFEDSLVIGISDIANAVAESDVFSIVDEETQETYQMPIFADPVAEEGGLKGFTADITGFKAAYVIESMRQPNPFIAYVFELEDASVASAFVADLESKKKLDFPVCMSADTTVSSIQGNFVFFAMIDEIEDEFGEATYATGSGAALKAVFDGIAK